MNNQINPKARIGYLALLVVVILLISYLAAGSFNPLDVYSSGSIFAKIIVSLFLVLLAISLLQQIVSYVIRKSVEVGTGEKAEDVICPGCGFPLIQFISSHGMPIRCPKCGEWWHNGPACYNKGMPHAKIVFPTYLCPRCRSDADHDRDLINDEDFTQFS